MHIRCLMKSPVITHRSHLDITTVYPSHLSPFSLSHDVFFFHQVPDEKPSDQVPLLSESKNDDKIWEEKLKKTMWRKLSLGGIGEDGEGRKNSMGMRVEEEGGRDSGERTIGLIITRWGLWLLGATFLGRFHEKGFVERKLWIISR